MSPAAELQLTVNGQAQRVPAGTCLLDLLEQLSEPHAVALVERNHRLVRKQDLAATALADGDIIEVILPAFGG